MSPINFKVNLVHYFTTYLNIKYIITATHLRLE